MCDAFHQMVTLATLMHTGIIIHTFCNSMYECGNMYVRTNMF